MSRDGWAEGSEAERPHECDLEPRPIFKVAYSNCTDSMNEPRGRGVRER